MQALIDYDGWRQWKDFSQDHKDDENKDGKGNGSTGHGTPTFGNKKKKNRMSVGSNAGAPTSHVTIKEETEPVGLVNSNPEAP
jgi:hypothetical protein